jgi:hypothetical protein
MALNRVLTPLAMLGLIAAGSLVLQRWVAETFLAALVLSVLWGLLVGGAFLLRAFRHRELLLPTVAALAIGGLGALAGFWYFSVRDVVVDEEIVVAQADAEAEPKRAAGPAAESRPSDPVALARGSFRGEDGHDGAGTATVVETADGRRLLTFSEFDVSPGPDVDVYLTRDAAEIDDRIELGDLKGNVGDQQYEIPASADIGRYDNVVLYCVSFTVRIAVAPLRA